MNVTEGQVIFFLYLVIGSLLLIPLIGTIQLITFLLFAKHDLRDD